MLGKVILLVLTLTASARAAPVANAEVAEELAKLFGAAIGRNPLVPAGPTGGGLAARSAPGAARTILGMIASSPATGPAAGTLTQATAAAALSSLLREAPALATTVPGLLGRLDQPTLDLAARNLFGMYQASTPLPIVATSFETLRVEVTRWADELARHQRTFDAALASLAPPVDQAALDRAVATFRTSALRTQVRIEMAETVMLPALRFLQVVTSRTAAVPDTISKVLAAQAVDPAEARTVRTFLSKMAADFHGADWLDKLGTWVKSVLADEAQDFWCRCLGLPSNTANGFRCR